MISRYHLHRGYRWTDRVHRPNPAFICVDCAVNTDDIAEYYMIHDHLWTGIGMLYDGGMLCIGCVENRLGRRLVRSDFTSAPINHGVFIQSERLQARLAT